MHLPIFRASGFQARQFLGLLVVRGADALPAPPLRRALLKGDIVERLAARQDRPQRLLLFGRWREFVLVAFAHTVALLFHRSPFCLIGKKPARIVAAGALWATQLASPC